MELSQETIQKLTEAYWKSSNADYSFGFINALSALGLSEEQIDEITKW
jgi:hypothetical protein